MRIKKRADEINSGDLVYIGEVAVAVVYTTQHNTSVSIFFDECGDYSWRGSDWMKLDVEVEASLKEIWGEGPFATCKPGGTWGRGTGNYLVGKRILNPPPFKPVIAMSGDKESLTVNIIEFNEDGHFRYAVSIGPVDSCNFDDYPYNPGHTDIEYYELKYPSGS